MSDKLRAGFGFSINQIDANAQAVTASLSGSTFNQTVSASGRDTAPAFNFGVLLQPHEKLSFGFTYSKGPSFVVHEDIQEPGIGGSFPGFPQPITIHVPDRVSVGGGVRVTPHLLLAADAVRVSTFESGAALVPRPRVGDAEPAVLHLHVRHG